MAKPFLSVVIPAYNEQDRITPTLKKVCDYLEGQTYSWEVVVVDDGSTDGTGDSVADWMKGHTGVRLEAVPHNGKGWAVRHGMLVASGEYRFMCDADLATPIEELERFFEEIDKGYEIVIGSRQIAGAKRYDEPVLRHVLGRLFNWTVRLLATRGFQDTQCGFKLFRGDVAEELFKLQLTRGWGFDVEILFLAAKKKMRVLEMPVSWHHQASSKVRAGVDSISMLADTVSVRWRNMQGKYDGEKIKPGTAPDAQDHTRDAEGVASSGKSTEAVEAISPDAQIAIVVPTYNEAENLPVMAERVFALGIPNTRLIIIDDGSPDGTGAVARELSKKFDGRLELIEREGKQGLGTAYVKGFSYALSSGADYVFQMDADLSHAPEYLPEFLKVLQENDVVVGSRYTSGGGVDETWGWKRRFLSSFANMSIRRVAGLRVKDATSGFKGYRSSALRSLDLDQFRCRGFGFQAEVASACQRRKHKVVEYPIMFVDRTKGQSKMSFSIMFEAFWRLMLLRWKK